MKTHWSAGAVAAAAFIAVSAILCAGQPESSARLTFDAASIKPVPPSDSPRGISMTVKNGHVVYSYVTVRALIRQAWGISKIFPPSTGPLDPLYSDRYDILAKSSADATDQQTRQMLQSLLEDRFGLKVHRETRELPLFALTAPKGNTKMRQATDDGTPSEIGNGGEGRRIHAHHVTMKQLAEAISGYVGDPVVDTTGLTGVYDFDLDFTPDQSLDASAASGTSVYTAIQEQLGLKLEARKGPVEVIVIDRLEKPTEN